MRKWRRGGSLRRVARAFYRDASAETAAALLEVGLRHPQPLVRVAAAASYAEVATDPMGVEQSDVYVDARFDRAMLAERQETTLRRQAEERLVLERKMREVTDKFSNAGLLLSKGQVERAEELIRDLPAIPEAFVLYGGFGLVHATKGEWQPALTNYQRAVSLAPDKELAYAPLAVLLLHAAGRRGRGVALGRRADPRPARASRCGLAGRRLESDGNFLDKRNESTVVLERGVAVEGGVLPFPHNSEKQVVVYEHPCVLRSLDTMRRPQHLRPAFDGNDIHRFLARVIDGK